jgi:hypothetical protein
VTVRPPMSINHLRLEVVPRAVDDDDQVFELRLMDAAGTAIMTFTLPEGIARALTATSEDWPIIMSPNGSVEVYNDDDPPRRLLKIELDELIRQNLTPDMLEDEPDLKTRLVTLRHKLMTSLALVDQTLADLDKPIA